MASAFRSGINISLFSTDAIRGKITPWRNGWSGKPTRRVGPFWCEVDRKRAGRKASGYEERKGRVKEG
jgi:hypothetical protein